jgi:hypothetical protein
VPAIVAELRALGDAYAELAARLAHTSAAELAAEPGLEAGEARAGELGYLLGVLSAAAGTGVLRARRLECAPRLFVELVAARHALALVPEARELPLAPRASLDGAEGWEGAFALAALFDAAARGAGGSLRWRIVPQRAGWLVTFPDAPRTTSARALCALGVRAHEGGALLPRAWLATPGSTSRALPG